MEELKKKTIYKWMGAIIGFSIILFAVIYFFNLQDDAVKVASNVKGGPPSLSYYVQGDVSTPLNKPMDVAKIGEFVYVTDTNNQQVQVFDSSGTPVFKFGKKGNGEGEFQFPYGITGDKDGNVYVADLYNAKISIFTPKGKFLKYFADENKKTDFLKSPAGLRIYNEKLYITDVQNNKVMIFSLKGEKLLEITAATAKDDSLYAPNAVTVDDDQNIYISDSGNSRVVVFDKKGKFIRLINGSKDGRGDSKFVNPRGLAILGNGNLLMVDNMTHFVYAFDKKGKQVFQFGGMGSDKEQLYLPNGLFIDDQGKVFITDTVNARVGIYY